ncbi:MULTISPECIES: divalent metal cation transporter [Caulobacter]|jgi:NRAMP (natural resistance-associated macrophage protein)-like metal ion transporter|uniref:Mn2+/Fe2 transporter, NRAMP family n=1 Tax=Caulobacter vibrioides OR37 TaxID=1292034 RepID=R0D455_CAUVI|nr:MULTISPECIES: divalent metal cation transporter [Caulobacter]ENZ83401.1 Mn2+/Fe2 transporter, NRAMP family [Caulobacter vibrioides OR37]MBQ1562728.1 divalent metal cation transporter [Caulobacter sp.]
MALDDEAERKPLAPRLRRLGPGLITGAADDDPSGIATYSQAGAQFGLNMLWTVVLTYPLMVAVQSISARIGRVTGHGLSTNLGKILPRWLVTALVGLLFFANTINIGADLAAMGAAGRLVTGANQHLLTIAFALVTVLLQVFVPYHRYVSLLKWLTLALFAYVAVVFSVKIDWGQVAIHTIFPRLPDQGWIVVVVAVFGTTISPYLFFWQSSEEVEEEEAKGAAPLIAAPEAAAEELDRIRWDTFIGMGVSNLIAFFIILTTAVTLNTHGITDIQTSEQAALALRPIAGQMAFLLFALGVVGTGLLGVPVLAGSVGYAIGELRGWTCGLERKPREAPAFYAVIVGAVVLGLVVDYSGLDPIKALFWSAVVNGVTAVPIMAAMMLVASRRQEMGPFVATRAQVVFGWLATLVMAVAAVGMFLTL